MASSLNISISKLISSIFEQKVQTEWSHVSKRLAGAWDDFSSLSEIRKIAGQDAQR